jgi:hypothetical protein
LKRYLIIAFLLIGSIAIAGNKIPKKLRKAYQGNIPEYSIEIDAAIVLIDKTSLSVELKKTHAIVKFGSTSYNLKIEDLSKKKSIYSFHFNFPEDTKIGRLEMTLDKKTGIIQVNGPGIVPDAELR